MFTRSKPSLFHAIVVIFLEFFAWGLLTLPIITVNLSELKFDMKLIFIALGT